MYENSRLSQRFLVSDSPSSLLGYMAHSDETVWKLFSHLETSVREGTNLQAKVSAQTTNDLFQVERGNISIISISRYETTSWLYVGVCVCVCVCVRVRVRVRGCAHTCPRLSVCVYVDMCTHMIYDK